MQNLGLPCRHTSGKEYPTLSPSCCPVHAPSKIPANRTMHHGQRHLAGRFPWLCHSSMALQPAIGFQPYNSSTQGIAVWYDAGRAGINPCARGASLGLGAAKVCVWPLIKARARLCRLGDFGMAAQGASFYSGALAMQSLDPEPFLGRPHSLQDSGDSVLEYCGVGAIE